jgi:hypothetical protein
MPREEMRRFDFHCEHCLSKANVNSAGAFGPDLAKKLAQLVKMEKNVMRSMEVSAALRLIWSSSALSAIAKDEI